MCKIIMELCTYLLFQFYTSVFCFKNIKMVNIDGEENDYNIKIIGYKVNDKGMYTVLLNI